ncbi:MAG TPA: glycosyltransferase 87 family protein [Candidatus Limnocylindrales bacterium]|nr:glycosyltransferase 87 family protein [Candidatus Limnocylindrales bacterium]
MLPGPRLVMSSGSDSRAGTSSGPGSRGVAGRLTSPVAIGSRRLPPIGLVVLAAVGLVLLAVIGAFEWTHLNDEYAYWQAGARLWAGQPLYDAAAAPNTPYAYWYPPPLAQVMAPLTAVLSADVFAVLWTALLLACLWWLGGRNVLVALALVAFLPVAVELRVRNVHLVIAVLAVLALRRSSLFWVPATALKITPVLGVVYEAAAGRWREAAKAGVLGGVVLVASLLLAPTAWREFVDVVGARAGTDGGSLFPAIPFAARLAAGAILAVVAGRLAARASARGGTAWRAESLLIVALVVANPTLWATAFSMLVAIVPLWRSREHEAAAAAAPVAGQVSVPA